MVGDDDQTIYFDVHGPEIPRTVHSEKQIQVHIAPGITVDGRIDLIRKLETDEVAIVDFKSSERAQMRRTRSVARPAWIWTCRREPVSWVAWCRSCRGATQLRSSRQRMTRW
jgi:hypothetical protein